MNIINRLRNDWDRAQVAPRKPVRDRTRTATRNRPDGTKPDGMRAEATELFIDKDILALFDEESALIGFEHRPTKDSVAPARLWTVEQINSIPVARSVIRKWIDDHNEAKKSAGPHPQLIATREMIHRVMGRIAPDGLDPWFGSVQGRRDYVA